MLTRRAAEAADATLVAGLISAAEARVDEKAKPAGEVDALESIQGIFGEVDASLLYDEAGTAVAFVELQMDQSRRRLYGSVFALPAAQAESLQVLRQRAAEAHADWDLWIGCNSKDSSLKTLLEDAGFSWLRSYWNLERKLRHEPYPVLPPGVTITVVSTPAEFERCHRVQQDAFAEHFGFAPRTVTEWIDLTKRSPSFDPNGLFLLEVDGEPVGFVECTDEHAHRSTGYVHGIGVRPRSRRAGFGHLLLEWACAYAFSRGFVSLELSVDSGNESGALGLYQSMGFTEYSSWEQWQRSDWATN